VKQKNLAGSLVLSGLNAFLAGVALLLGYSGISPWWGALIIWIVSPPLLLFAGAYVIRDLLYVSTRKQALLALVVFIPVVILDWHWRFTGI
jgi:hypothetical protein